MKKERAFHAPSSPFPFLLSLLSFLVSSACYSRVSPLAGGSPIGLSKSSFFKTSLSKTNQVEASIPGPSLDVSVSRFVAMESGQMASDEKGIVHQRRGGSLFKETGKTRVQTSLYLLLQQIQRKKNHRAWDGKIRLRFLAFDSTKFIKWPVKKQLDGDGSINTSQQQQPIQPRQTYRNALIGVIGNNPNEAQSGVGESQHLEESKGEPKCPVLRTEEVLQCCGNETQENRLMETNPNKIEDKWATMQTLDEEKITAALVKSVEIQPGNPDGKRKRMETEEALDQASKDSKKAKSDA